MAGVAVIQAKDVVRQRVSYDQSCAKPMRCRRNSTSNPLPTPNPNNNRRKRSPQKNGSVHCKNLHLVMGEVKILKRGQVLNVVKENKLVSDGVVEDLVLSTPDPKREQITIADFYAGSAFVSSPPPSSLPVPAFFKKKSEDKQDATSDLRRLHLSSTVEE